MARIFKKILTHKKLNLKEKAKRLVYYYARKRGAKVSWDKRHQKIFTLHKSYNDPCAKEIEAKHRKIWSDFRKNVDLSTLRICKNISGQVDPRIVPEEVFVSDIEPTLILDEAGRFQCHKSLYNQYFPEGIFPKGIFHNIAGQYLDSNLEPITFNELKRQSRDLSYPVVIKPNWNTYGGKDVFFPRNVEMLVSLCKDNSKFVVQEYIKQHEFFRKYNPLGINTLRVNVYRSIKDNSLNILNAAFRMGRGGSLDNETDGGIYTMIKQDGSMNKYAVDKFGEKFTIHPDTDYYFTDKIPALDELKKTAIKICKQVYFTRLVGLDMCYDESGNWRVIEINIKGLAMRLSQYGGQPFFGEFTEEVIEHCKKNHWALNTDE